MENQVYRCPQCHGRVLSSEAEGTPEDLPAHEAKLYCPSCEMLVEPVLGSVDDPASPARSDSGRTRAGGTNAGGSQRGDLSDQGASQWRQDPREGERNTWSDKE